MKKLLLSLSLLFAVGLLVAQVSWSDDLEAYNDGDFIGAQGNGWTTWSGNPGGGDDSQVTNELARSGTNSLKFIQTASAGGPADVLLNFGGKYTSGSFVLKFWMYIVSGTGAYYNFQGETTPGRTWTMNTYFEADGSVRIADGSSDKLSGTFPHDEWFEVVYSIDLTNNAWETIINDQCLGVFENGNNSLASLDIYPLSSNNQAVFFMDDFSYEYKTEALPPIALDASLNSLGLKTRSLAGVTTPISGTIRNNGTDAITSFEVSFDDGANPFNEEFTGLNIASGETYDFETSESYTFVEGSGMVNMTLVSVNGSADEKTCNDSKSQNVEGVVPAPDRAVLIEEATGTWCQFCPRGDVFLNLLNGEYGHYFIPIAAHNRDPMAIGHDAWITQNIGGFTGYPQVTIDRNPWIGFGTVADIENPFLTYIQSPPSAVLENGATWDASTRELNVSVAAEFNQDGNSGQRLGLFIVEDNVTGTDAGYAQSNAYAGGARGPMGGYENLPNPVPANQMVYRHVSRAAPSGFDGMPIGNGVVSGTKVVHNYSYTVPADHDENEILLVAFITNTQGRIDNVYETTLQEAIDNGFEVATSNEDLENRTSFQIFPNPAINYTTVDVVLDESAPVLITVFDMSGVQVAHRDYGNMSGAWSVPVDLSNMATGTYHVKVQIGDQFTSKKIQVIK